MKIEVERFVQGKRRERGRLSASRTAPKSADKRFAPPALNIEWNRRRKSISPMAIRAPGTAASIGKIGYTQWQLPDERW